ncbi:phenylacetaldehyde dehydrogenase [Acidocella aquatica]|uniref:Phenylacetaldehyde dehydrogenase n=2 Tax=Acidocella aquatica TaxID=1922313 RepID=A0ABQ6A5P9_9PROT|nr:phenylacetaldehyde dehydrogenase [Acidocella aquatica]
MARPPGLLIGGEWVAAQGSDAAEVINPATGRIVSRISLGGEADIDRAVCAARLAFDDGRWTKMRPAVRAKLLHKLADLMEQAADDLALIETLDNGMPFGFARNLNVQGAIEGLRYQAGWVTKLNGETRNVSLPGEWHTYTLREPLGVAGLIVPWNVPLAITLGKIGPALAAGCTVVLKPAEQTSLSALKLGQLVQEAGFPPGVINIVTGLGTSAGAALVAHPGIDKISFTGSTDVGKKILASAAQTMKRVSLELGGKSPVIIFPDADLDLAVEAAAMGIFSNTGQVCAAGSRLFVHRAVFDRVVAGVEMRARALRVGPGIEPETQIGPVVSEIQQSRVLDYVRKGVEQGAEILTGGRKIDRAGYFVEPTIFVQTRPEMSIMREEIFGPVLCAMPFDDETLDEIALKANDTMYGLSASVWTRDLQTAHKMVRRIKSGTVRVNAAASMDPAMPFGGYKQSGIGREQGREGVEAFTEIKSVAVNLGR